MSRGNADDLATLLRERIRKGAWAAAERMPTERALAEELGVARNTVRRALDRLEQEGAIARHVGRGTYVRAESAEAASPLLDIVERLKQVSPADMMEFRLLLEPAAAELAAINASAAELAAIRDAHAAAKAAAAMPDFEHWDTELHRRIFAAARNGLLHEMHELLRILRTQAPWFEMKQRSFSEARRQAYCAQHEAIVDAIERRLPADASAAMRAHLRSVRENLLGRP